MFYLSTKAEYSIGDQEPVGILPTRLSLDSPEAPTHTRNSLSETFAELANPLHPEHKSRLVSLGANLDAVCTTNGFGTATIFQWIGKYRIATHEGERTEDFRGRINGAERARRVQLQQRKEQERER